MERKRELPGNRIAAERNAYEREIADRMARAEANLAAYGFRTGFERFGKGAR